MYVCMYVNIYIYILGRASASLSVEARSYFLHETHVQKLFPKSTLNWKTV